MPPPLKSQTKHMSSPLVGLQPLRQPAPNANHDMTWLYIVETEAEERPSDAVVAEVHAGDIERERRPPPSYTLIRPRGAIIRCTLCLHGFAAPHWFGDANVVMSYKEQKTTSG